MDKSVRGVAAYVPGLACLHRRRRSLWRVGALESEEPRTPDEPSELKQHLSTTNRAVRRHPPAYFSLDRLVVPRGVFLGPAFRVSLVRAPCARTASCFP